MFSHASISSFRSLCLDKSQWNLLKALCKFQLVVNGRRDYGLTIFAYSLSAFQASSHIKRWPRGKPSGENSRPAPPPSFILIFTWCCEAAATCIVLKNLLGRVKDQWSGSWDEQHHYHFWVNKSAGYLDMDRRRHIIILGQARLPLLDILDTVHYVHILVKMMQIIFLRSHRFYESYRYFGPLCYNSNHK